MSDSTPTIVEAPAPDAGLHQVLERVMLAPDVPVERIEKLIELQERIQDKALARAQEARDWEARRLYMEAMAEVQAEMPAVTRNRRNTHTKSEYADLGAIAEQAMAIAHKAGFSVSFRTADLTDAGIKVFWRCAHRGGHSEEDFEEVPLDGAGMKGGTNKTAIQAFGSTVTYARRYIIMMLFNIAVTDDDGNAKPRLETTISEDQYRELRNAIEEHSMDTDRLEALVLQAEGIGHLAELPEARFRQTMDNIAKTKA